MNKQLEKGYVYLLVSQDLKTFKIGKANEVNTRIDQLSKFWNFNLNKSFIIETNFDNTLNLERLLHRFLANYKIDILAKRDGYTEFFDINGLDFIFEFKELLNKTNNAKIMNYKEFIEINNINKKCKLTLKEEVKEIKEKEIYNIIKFSKVNSLFELDMFFTICDKYLRTLEQEVIIKMADISGENTLKIKKQRNFNEERITQNLINFLLNPVLGHNKSLINKDYRRSGKSFIFTINEDFFNKELFSLIIKINHKKMFGLKSIYSKQMYILIKQIDKNTEFSKDFLDNYFYLPPSLREYASFKQRVLNYSSKEIYNAMGIEIKYREIKKGRAVSSINLSSKLKDKFKENLTNIENQEEIIKKINISEKKLKEKQKPINNVNYNIYKSYNYSYTTQPLINTLF